MRSLCLAIMFAALTATLSLVVVEGLQVKDNVDKFHTAYEDFSNEVLYGDDFELPQDARGWFTTIYTSDNWQNNPAEYQLVQWFNTNPGLLNLRAQTKFMHLTPKNAIYKNYGSYTNGGTTMAVTLIDNNGKPIYKASAKHIPKTPILLLKAIKHFIMRDCPDCPLRPHKPHLPQPAPPEFPNQPYFPDSVDEEEEEIDLVEKQDSGWIIAGICGAISFGAVFMLMALRPRRDGT